MEAIVKRLRELNFEAEQLVNQRDQMYKHISDIDVRLHQVVGAIQELNNLKEGSENEVSSSDQSQVPISADETK